MKDWYDNLEAREQVFVLIGALFIAFAIVYYLLWVPLEKSHRQVETSVQNWERSLAELRPLRAMVASGNVSPSAGATMAFGLSSKTSRSTTLYCGSEI